MTNGEIRMTKVIRNPKLESRALGYSMVARQRLGVSVADRLGAILISCFVLLSSFVIRHSSFPLFRA